MKIVSSFHPTLYFLVLDLFAQIVGLCLGYNFVLISGIFLSLQEEVEIENKICYVCIHYCCIYIYIYIYIGNVFCINNLVMLCMFRHMFNIIFEWIRYLFGRNFYDDGDLFEVEKKFVMFVLIIISYMFENMFEKIFKREKSLFKVCICISQASWITFVL